MSRCRNWCFTLNWPEEDDFKFWEKLEEWRNFKELIFVILQEEKGENGTTHFQGYLEMKKARKMVTMKNMFGARYHWAARRGTQAQAIAYCRKADTRVEGGLQLTYGTPKRAGKGGDFSAAIHAIKNGMDIEDVMDEFPVQYAMHKDRVLDYALTQKGERHWAMEIEIYVGPSGTGKSWTAGQDVDSYVVPWPCGGRWWWPNYTGQWTVIMDEFRHQIKMDVMLKMMDRYVWHLEAKGRSFQFCSRKIIITTNIDPKDWYPNLTREVKAPLARRINEFATIYDFTAGEYPDFQKTKRVGNFEFNREVGFGMIGGTRENAGYNNYN